MASNGPAVLALGTGHGAVGAAQLEHLGERHVELGLALGVLANPERALGQILAMLGRGQDRSNDQKPRHGQEQQCDDEFDALAVHRNL
jgi:hypothetical protein